jgi:hypothetical protein
MSADYPVPTGFGGAPEHERLPDCSSAEHGSARLSTRDGRRCVRSGHRELVHRSGRALSLDFQALHSFRRVLTTYRPAGVREQGTALTGVGPHVVVGGCERGICGILVHGGLLTAGSTGSG